jgi:hypothetical protein
MPRARDFLDRFRPVATPGAASELGVPADRVAEVSVELAPVFAALAPVEEETARWRRDAAAEAARRLAAAEAAAEAIVSGARRTAEQERLAVAAEAARRGEAEADAVLTAAAHDAAAVAAGAAARMPELLERVRDAMRGRLEERA